MIKYKNEIINVNNILYIKEYPNAISIHFVGDTIHWFRFEDEKTKIAILTSIKLQIK